MEEEFVEIEVEDSSLCLDDEIDHTYEFDAPMFCDFTKEETFLDACEAEQWFEFAQSYPPSPFLIKFKWGSNGQVESEQVSTMEDNNNKDGKKKTLSRSSSSTSKAFTFMKPTASHLAKLKKNPPEVQNPKPQTSRRNQEKSSSSISSTSTDGQLSKRQKLEAGYSRKVAQLKHQNLLTHKKTKEVDHTDASKPNVTIPKTPNLQTALRAQKHKSRTNTESSEHSKSSFKVPKARPLPNKGGVTLNSNSVSNSETRTNTSVGSRQEKSKMISKLRGSTDNKKLSSKGERGVFKNIKVHPLEQNDKSCEDEPPTELLSKLTLTSEAKQTAKSQSKEQSISKGLKENRQRSLRHEHEMMNLVKEEIQRLYGKQYQCAHEMGSLVTKHTSMLELGH
ncbi:uncharacterized protein LOC123911486 isoform X1 [Trifolium pratense]|nr:uncharacterized protein LOC123911486 isoform X1 [Trifolium pratense]